MRQTISTKRVIALMLALLMALPLVACGKNGDGGGSQTGEVETTFIDNVETEDFGGAEFKFAVLDKASYEMFAEEATGNSENDSVYNRNKKIGNRFNVKIGSEVYENGDALEEDFRTGVAAGEVPFDVAMDQAFSSCNLIMEKVVIDWNEVENLELSQKWWNSLSNDSATVNNKAYAITGDIAITTLTYTWGMFVNLNLAQDWNIDTNELYQTVLDGKWTLDTMQTMVKGIYRDLNGNSEKDVDDIYGYMAGPGDCTDVWPMAMDNPITGRDSDGNVILTFMTDKMTDAYSDIFDLHWNNEGAFAACGWDGELDYFVKGNVVFAPMYFHRCFSELKDMSDEYSILPYPKYNESQSNYYTSALDEYSVLLLPLTTEDTNMVGKIVESMCAESYNSVMPTWYDIALKGKYANDVTTQKLIELIMSGRRFDFALLFGMSLKDISYLTRTCLKNRYPNINSRYAPYETRIKNKLAEIVAVYQ